MKSWYLNSKIPRKFFYVMAIFLSFLSIRESFSSTEEEIKQKEEISATLSVENTVFKDSSSCKGDSSIFGKMQGITFLDGKVDFIRGEFQFNLYPVTNVKFSPETISDGAKPQEGNIFIGGRLKPDSSFSLHTRLDHLKIKGVDICSDIYAEGQYTKDINGKINLVKGTLKTLNSVINLHPFKELEVSYQIDDRFLKISFCKLGEEFQISGTIELVEPYTLDLTIDVVEADTSSLTVLTGIKAELFSGLVNGKVQIKGPLSSPYLKGYLEAMEGQLGNIRYRSAKVNLSGYDWSATVSDSRVNKENGFLTLEGEVDFKKFGTSSLLENLKLKSDQRTIVWDGWDITREERRDEISLKKEVGESFQVNFKSFLNDDLKEENMADEEGEAALEYKLKGNKSLKMRMRRYEDFLSLEQRVRF